jgi:predicted DNA-binding transcriptional regulator AlpA
MTRWPAMMKRKTAAEYLDTSEAAFEREVSAGRLPAPIMLGKREHWCKDALDAAIAILSGDTPEPSYRNKLRERYEKAA